MKRAWWLILLMIGVVGCGYSKEELQKRLNDQRAAMMQDRKQAVAAERAAHAKTKKALEAAMARVAALEDQLKQMGLRLKEYGVNLDQLSKKLKETGSEKQELTSRLEKMNKALEEYRARAQQLAAIKERFQLLKQKLEKLTNLGLKVEIRRNRMVIRLPGDVLFASGSDKLQKKGKEVVAAVSDVIRKDESLSKRYFQVAGHTDDRPLKGGPFKDNWGLSAMRARSVLVYMIAPVDARDGGGGLNPEYLHAAGYGSTDPVAPNNTPKGRQQNRRVELVVMPDVSEMLDLKTLL